MSYTPLPIGVDDFEKIITKGYYYVDKTNLIKDILDKGGEVNLFTRPRRFGKTLNLSMLKYFFEKPINGKSNAYLFDGLKIMSAGEKYTGEQEQYPVISLTLKSAKQSDFKTAYHCLKEDIANEFARHNYVLETDKITDANKKKFAEIRDRKADDEEYARALQFLSECLYLYHDKKTIILIDEYDVPLETSYFNGFYDKMVSFIRSLFESALKTNLYLEFAVITGCLRISKESIFTGLNNLEVISILNENYGEYFGFLEEEVAEMLRFYDREKQTETMKEWYDGYLFGNNEVYNPWSVINYTKALATNENAFPTPAWCNTSSNSIVKDLIYHANDDVKDEIQSLMNGGTIEKKIHEDITYADIHSSEDNLWNFLFFTGYLKKVSMRMEGINRYLTMKIPNNELLYIYENEVENWFRDEIKVQDLSVLYSAIVSGKVDIFQKEIAKQLHGTISYMDSAESFYHGFLLGILSNMSGVSGYRLKSNRESGNGRYDICIYTPDLSKPPIIFELKVSPKFKQLDETCDKALEQIKNKKYAEEFEEDGYTEIMYYGISFFKKQLRIKLEYEALDN